MGNDTGAQAAQAERHAFAARRDALFSSYVQTLLAINGGAIVAVGGMAQALVKQQAWLGYRPYASWALAMFIIGVICAAVTYYARLMQIVNNDSAAHAKVAKRYGKAVGWFSGVSLLAFLIGSIVAATGIANI